MANIIYKRQMDMSQKVLQMQEDARFDVASSTETAVPELSFITNQIKSKQLPPKVPKVFLSNNCIFNCAYCGCRSSNECKNRYETSPRELAELAVKQAAQNHHGIFITSAITRNADYTEELIIETLRIIREELNYKGYIHAKVMPGAHKELIYKAGVYADRLSVNIEVAKSIGYSMIAKNKNIYNILTPMNQISQMIKIAKSEKSKWAPTFATSQSTQLMAGSTGEDDKTILQVTDTLYKKYNLKRVYYTAFQYHHQAVGYDGLSPVETPQWRVHRLYQADRLMQLYGFTPDEIAPDSAPYLQENLDPKAAWALRNLHFFPVEVNTADYEMLLRVPGIGVIYAKRILEARKNYTITHDVLESLGISLKNCNNFITCNGKFHGISDDNESTIYKTLLSTKKKQQYQQLSLPL